MVAQRAGVQLEAKTGSKYYLITEYRSIFMRQLKEMLHLGTPANVQDVLVQDHANYLPVRALQMQQMVLRRNPPDVGVTSGQKSCTKIIYIVLQTSVRLF